MNATRWLNLRRKTRQLTRDRRNPVQTRFFRGMTISCGGSGSSSSNVHVFASIRFLASSSSNVRNFWIRINWFENVYASRSVRIILAYAIRFPSFELIERGIHENSRILIRPFHVPYRLITSLWLPSGLLYRGNQALYRLLVSCGIGNVHETSCYKFS